MYLASGVVGHRGTVLKRFAIWVAVLAVAVAAGFGLGALTYVPPDPEMNATTNTPINQATPSPGDTSGPQVIPDLVGLQRATAEKRLDDLSILFLVNPVGGKDDDRVMSQNPAAGIPIGQAKHVLLSVRCRPRPCPMPPEGKQMYDPCACLWR